MFVKEVLIGVKPGRDTGQPICAASYFSSTVCLWSDSSYKKTVSPYSLSA